MRFSVDSIDALDIESGSVAGVVAWQYIIHVVLVAMPAADTPVSSELRAISCPSNKLYAALAEDGHHSTDILVGKN